MPSLIIPHISTPPQAQTYTPPPYPPPHLHPTASSAIRTDATSPDQAPTSPVAPEFSPITPKANAAIPATYFPQPSAGLEATVPTVQYIPLPPPQPFSSDNAPDAIALRAAISSLQFQKKKAKDDIRALETLKKQALAEPRLFATELAAGRLKDEPPRTENLLQTLLDAADSESDEDEVLRSGSNNEPSRKLSQSIDVDTEMTVSHQRSHSARSNSLATPPKDIPPPFGKIPNTQNVVRMPPINWDKYHIVGERLDALHEQQRKWPGSNFAYGQPRGREHVVAAPYSPWLDPLDSQQQGWGAERRNDSVTTPMMTSITSEHPMETRKRQRLNE